MKRTIVRASVGVALATALLAGFSARTDTAIQGRTFEVPCEFKIVSIQYVNKKPMVTMRPMRADEHPEVWFVKPLDELESEPAAGESTIIVRECSEVIRK